MLRERAWIWALLLSLTVNAGAFGQAAASEGAPDRIVQAQIILTVSESKRLIAKAIPRLPVVAKALKNGTVIVAKGTTNTYVAEEITGRKIPHGPYVYGRTYPAKGGKQLPDGEPISEVVLVKGKIQPAMPLSDAVKLLKPGDVVIKGANALDYPNKTAGVLIGGGSAGTSGKIMPYVVGQKAHLVIPVGLEKQVSGKVVDIQLKMREPIESLNAIPSMFLLTGHIVTEIEALKLLAGVSAFQAAGGGIGGAEGAVRLVYRGTRKQVEKALEITGQIHGEPPFVE
jgi:hypothetical protein